MKNTIRLSRVLFVLTLLLVTYLALSSIPEQVTEHFFFNDKLNHILALATLSFLWDYASFHSKINILVKVAPLLLIALILEVLQLATTTRVFELTDIVAGAFGIGIYWTLQFLSRRKLDHLLEKLIG